MNRTLKLVCAICSALVLLEGCDFVRTLAGRPTSVQIERMRSSIQRADSVRKAQQLEASDSLKNLHSSDSTAAEEYIKTSRTVLRTPSECRSEIDLYSLPADYYVMLGSFKSPENAGNFQALLSKSGYVDPKIIPFSNGLRGVAIPVTGDVVQLRDVLLKIRSERFCPPDFWVLRIPKE